MRSGNASKMSWDEWIAENKEKAFRVANGNTKHDKDGHCLFPRDDPWMR